MRTKSELEFIKRFIDNTYSRWGNLVMVNDSKPFNPDNPELGYCYKYKSEDGKTVIYKINCSKIGIKDTDFRVMMHEYGHIYLGHLEGIYEELDTQICNVFRDYRGELIERVNKECGIDFAEKLIERVIDDPVLNHSLHNIAMDMEVNSKILSKDDVEEMEMDISSVLPKYGEELLKYQMDQTKDESIKKELEDELKKMENEAKIKLIVPERYHLSDGSPFPPELSYPEYLILIVKNLDQFVKMLVSIKNGGNGDTSDISQEDIKNALNNSSSGSGNGEGMQGLSDLMEQMGMSSSSDGNGQQGDQGNQNSASSGNSGNNGSEKSEKSGNGDPKYKGTRDGNGSEKGDSSNGMKNDHRTDSRDEADKKRKLGQIKAGGGVGCGNSGGPDATRIVNKRSDEVDMALNEVINNFRHRVVKRDSRKDIMYLYNRGINRTVIAPTIRRKTSISEDPTIVFLIDISGSMETDLVDRILNTISKNIKRLGRGLRYNIITWSTSLGEHIQNIDPRKGVPRISMGGGTRMAGGIKYFKENYSPEAILILISDFEDYLEEWGKIESTMPEYTMYGFNYGSRKYGNNSNLFKYLKVRDFKNGY